MSKDSSLPPGNSSDAEDAEGFPADADEIAAASALARALEGRSTAGVPDSALETAALLRYSSAAGELSNERRAALREQVLASVPAVSPRSGSVGAGSPRQRFWRWFGLVMPLAGAAAALWLVVGAFRQAAEPELSRLADSHTAQSAAPAEGAAAPGGAQAANDTAAEDNAAENTAAAETAQDTAASDRALRAATAPEAEAAPSALAYRMAAPSPAALAGPASEERGSGAGLGAA
ncbi:MAG TPA: hypothetical protein VJU61_02590, partial [Polyangiaceae bacterium]|nr:hypothetical protein [Polyangiaceae bacterium]